MNFFNKVYKFMHGRYGIDEVYKVGLVVCVLLSFINIFANNRIVSLIETLLIIIIVYRAMSRDIYKRRRENMVYLNFKKKFFKRIDKIKVRWRDRNTHIYRKCPKCKTVLRLPLVRGKHVCKCPKCSHKFTVFCFRNEKIKVEVIK